MEMSLKLTEKDKKLILILLIVILLAGLGGRVVLPLMESNNQLKIQLEEAQLEKAQKEIKVSGLETMRAVRNQAKEAAGTVAARYSKVVRSEEIDRVLTETCLEKQVNILGLAIYMPAAGVNTSITDYPLMLRGVSSQDIIRTFSGFSTASTVLRISGSQEALQSVLDTLSHREPYCRVTAFRWETGRDDTVALSINLDIYMMESPESYAARAALAAAQAALAAQAEQAA